MLTGEAVVIDVPIARFPSRMIAILIDVLLQAIALLILNLTIGLAAGLNGASLAAVLLVSSIMVIVAYPVIFETLSRGKSLGKLAMGLRVVGDDGSPERFRQALVRGLAGAIEIWTLFGSPALITSLLSAKGKRLGDLFAGTFVIQERVGRGQAHVAAMPPTLAGWASTLELSALPDALANAVRDYLGRYWELNPQARYQLGESLAADVAARTSPPPPPGTRAPDFLSAVLAERRSRQISARARHAGGSSTASYL